jgi:hypothetical protein
VHLFRPLLRAARSPKRPGTAQASPCDPRTPRACDGFGAKQD